MKKSRLFCGLLMVGTILLFCVAYTNNRKLSAKEEIFLLVQENEEKLELLLPFFKELNQGEVVINDPNRKSEKWIYYLDFNNESLNQIMEIFSIKFADFVEEAVDKQECINFSCEVEFFGIIEYRGFYYVEDGKPVGWGGVKFYHPTEKEGAGYIYRGSGIYYTEKIVGNWYYYEKSF